MNAHQIAQNLCEKAEKLGLCHPTESMISDCLANTLSNHLLEIDYALRDARFVAAADYLEKLHKVQEMETGQ